MPYKDVEAQKAAQRRSYEKNKDEVIQRAASYRAKTNEIIRELKSGPCTDCKETYPYYVMQFDHISGDKVADVNRLVRTRSRGAVLAEIDKCELVCANCHAIRTFARGHKNQYSTP